MTRSRIPSLLFRQTLILALIAGACSVRVPAVAAGIFVMLVFVPEWKSGKSFLTRLLKLSVAFLIGLAVTVYSMPEVPDKPSWASVPRQAVLVEGVAESVTGLPGGRVRLLIKGLKPAGIPADVEADRAEKIRKAMSPPRFASAESGRKSYAGGVFHDDAASLPGLAALTLEMEKAGDVSRPIPGQRIRALVRLYPSGGSRNAMESGPGSYWAAREVWHNARLVRQKGEALFLRFYAGEGWRHDAAERREAWRSAMEGMAGEDCSQGRAMLAALLFGDRSGLSLRTVDIFTRSGLIHSLALSGQHLALAALAGVLCIFLASLFMPGLYRRCPKRTLIALGSLPFALCYLFLGGAPFSLMRAAFMLSAGALFLCLRRPTAPLDALFAAVLLLFLVWPQAVFDLSAQLSVLAVAGIILSMPLLSVVSERLAVPFDTSFLIRMPRKFLTAVISLLIVSCAAQAAVLPILASVFGAVSPCFWLNVLWLPLLTFITLPLAAIGLVLLMTFGAQAVSALLFEVASWPADIMLDFLELLDAGGLLPFVQCFRPAPLSALGYGAVFAALALAVQAKLLGKIMPAAVKRLFAFGIVFMLAGQTPQWADEVKAAMESRVSLSMIDVGAGQAVLLEYPGGRMLIDGGGNNSQNFDCGRSIVAPRLTEGRMPRLDAVIVSHCDVDHARGLRWILEHFQVGALYWSPVSAHRADSGEGKVLRETASRRGIPERVLRRGDSLQLGRGLKLEVLAPDAADGAAVPSKKALSSNDASLALRLSCDDQGLALLCGDMLSSALGRLAESGQRLDADALVLPHHGAASSFHKKFYDRVSPSAALASTAPFSHFGFPSRKVRQEMEERGIPLLSTSELGSFSIRWKWENGRYALIRPLPQP